MRAGGERMRRPRCSLPSLLSLFRVFRESRFSMRRVTLQNVVREAISLWSRLNVRLMDITDKF
jgi:hypothetical protein